MKTFSLEYTKQHLDRLCDIAVQSEEGIVIKRSQKASVALISLAELNSLKETLYLLSSPANAKRIFEALEEARSGTIQPQTIDELFAELDAKYSE
jgi:antitoxin YefM